MRAFQVNLKACLGLVLPNLYYLIVVWKVKLVFGWLFSWATPTPLWSLLYSTSILYDMLVECPNIALCGCFGWFDLSNPQIAIRVSKLSIVTQFHCWFCTWGLFICFVFVHSQSKYSQAHILLTGIDIIVETARNELCKRYTQSRYIPSTDDWPPYHPKYYTPLTIVHHEGRCTESEVIRTAEEMALSKMGTDK